MKATGKDHARVNLAIWGDDDFLDLRVDEQALYLTLWTSPGLSYCGAGTWHSGRLANLADDWTADRVDAAAAGLSRALFVLIDSDTDEFLIRSWIKHDGLWRTPNMAVSMANARAELASRALRGVVVHEVRKIRDANPDSSSWKRSAVASMLEQSEVDPAGLQPFVAARNPSPNPAGKGWGQPIGSTPAPRVSPTPGANPGPTPAPSPAPFLLLQLAALALSRASTLERPHGGENEREIPASPLFPARRLVPLPEGWQPNDLHASKARGLGITDFAAATDDFRQWALAQGVLKADWSAAFHQWLANPRTLRADRERRESGGTGAMARGAEWRQAGAQAADFLRKQQQDQRKELS